MENITLYVISNETNQLVARIHGLTNQECERAADAEYGSDDYYWSYTPAFGFSGGAEPGEDVRDIEAPAHYATPEYQVMPSGVTHPTLEDALSHCEELIAEGSRSAFVVTPDGEKIFPQVLR